MKVYIVRVCRGSWDDAVSFNIGTFSTLEKAERVREKWFEQVELALWKNPKPLNVYELELYEDGELNREKTDLYLNWKYELGMNKVLENQNAELYIEEVEVDKEDFDIFK